MKKPIRTQTSRLVCLLLLILAGCSSGSKTKSGSSSAGIPATPASVPWQRPQTAISHDTPLAHLTGIMRFHQNTVNDVAFSANGIRMASVDAHNNTVVWNLANGETLFVRSDNDGRRVFFGPNDETLITVNRDGFTRIWDMNMSLPRELQERLNFAGHDSTAGVVVQSPDRRLLAFGARSGGIRIWQVPEGQLVANIDAHGDSIQYLAFSPDGTRLASLGADRGVRVWGVPGGALAHDLVNPRLVETDQTPMRAAFSPDSTRLAVANVGGIQVWDMVTGQSIYFIETADNNATAALIFSPDGSLLVGCGLQPLIGVWKAATSEWVAGLPIPGQSCAQAAFSLDGTLLMTLPSPGKDLYLWNLTNLTAGDTTHIDVAKRENMGLFPGPRFWNFAWSEDGRFVVVLDELGPMYMLTAVG